MGDQSLARLIKRRRDALGFSQARLGELVGRSASTIRNWERGNSTPSERSDAIALAAVLGLDEREVLEGAGFDVEAAGTDQTVEQAYASLAPETPLMDESAPQEEAAALREEVEEPDLKPEERAESDEPETGRVVGEPDNEPADDKSSGEEARQSVAGPANPVVEEKPPVPEAGPWRGADEEEEVVDEAPVSRPIPPPPDEPAPAPSEEPTPSRRLVRAAPPTVLEATPPGEPSYLEDPQERQQYRIRAMVTAALVVGLFIVLMWAFGRASDAFSALWDSFFDQLRI